MKCEHQEHCHICRAQLAAEREKSARLERTIGEAWSKLTGWDPIRLTNGSHTASKDPSAALLAACASVVERRDYWAAEHVAAAKIASAALAAQKAVEERALLVEADHQKALAALDLLRKQNAIGFCAAPLLRGYCVREKGHGGHHYPSIEDVIEELEGEKRAHAAHHAAENGAPQAPAAEPKGDK